MKKQTKAVISKSERIYSFLLDLYPKDFKDEYKELLNQLFKDMLREASELNTRKGVWKL